MRKYKVVKGVKNRVSKCFNCGSTENIEYHHIVPLCYGGNDIPSNVVPLCQECHSKAHGKVWKTQRKARTPKVPYEKAKGYISKYFNNEIGAKELKSLLLLSENTKIKDNPNVKRYMLEFDIDGRFRNTVDIKEHARNRYESTK